MRAATPYGANTRTHERFDIYSHKMSIYAAAKQNIYDNTSNGKFVYKNSNINYNENCLVHVGGAEGNVVLTHSHPKFEKLMYILVRALHTRNEAIFPTGR